MASGRPLLRHQLAFRSSTSHTFGGAVKVLVDRETAKAPPPEPKPEVVETPDEVPEPEDPAARRVRARVRDATQAGQRRPAWPFGARGADSKGSDGSCHAEAHRH